MQSLIELKAGKGRQLHGLVIAVLCTATGIWAYLFADDSFALREWTAGLLVAIGLAIMLWSFFGPARRAKVLTLSPQGIWYERWGPAMVPWPHIARIYARGGRLRRFLCLELKDYEGLLESFPGNVRKAFEASEMIKPPLLLIPYGAVDRAPDELAALMEQYLQK